MYRYLILCLLLTSCKDVKNKFNKPFYSNITIDFSNTNIPDDSVIYLEKYDLKGQSIKIDSFRKSGNTFQIIRKFSEPFQAILTKKSNKAYSDILSPMFIVTNDAISIKLDAPKIVVSGGENEFYEKNRSYHDIPHNLNRHLIEELLNKNGTIAKSDSQYELWSSYENHIYKWVSENSKKYYTIIKLYDSRFFLSDVMLKKCLSELKNNFEKTKTYNLLINYLLKKESIRKDRVFPNFPVLDINGNAVTYLNIFEPNKEIYIIDFWASWCGGCRIQARKLKLNYSLLDTTKIQLISISIDRNAEDWKKAYEKENYPWKSYMLNKNLDKGSLESTINYIPAYFVLDRNKKITGRYFSIDSISSLKTSK